MMLSYFTSTVEAVPKSRLEAQREQVMLPESRDPSGRKCNGQGYTDTSKEAVRQKGRQRRGTPWPLPPSHSAPPASPVNDSWTGFRWEPVDTGTTASGAVPHLETQSGSGRELGLRVKGPQGQTSLILLGTLSSPILGWTREFVGRKVPSLKIYLFPNP